MDITVDVSVGYSRSRETCSSSVRVAQNVSGLDITEVLLSDSFITCFCVVFTLRDCAWRSNAIIPCKLLKFQLCPPLPPLPNPLSSFPFVGEEYLWLLHLICVPRRVVKLFCIHHDQIVKQRACNNCTIFSTSVHVCALTVTVFLIQQSWVIIMFCCSFLCLCTSEENGHCKWNDM